MAKIRPVGLVAVLSLAAFCTLAAQQANPLAAAYPIKVGDMAAQMLSEFLRIPAEFNDPRIVFYEPSAHTIDVEVYATPRVGSKTDQARALLGQYWEYIKAAHIPYVDSRFGVKLDVQHYRLRYYERNQNGATLVLQFVNGQYTIP